MFFRLLKVMGLACLFTALGGCVSTDISDLEQFMAEVLARPGGAVTPLPEIEPYEAYAYQSGANDARDPFRPYYLTVIPEGDESFGLTEEQKEEVSHRNKEELEQFELDSLRMVGTLQSDADQWAIIVAPEGEIYRVTVGNYVGRNTGKVLNVSEDKIEVRELVKDGQGRWSERQAAIALEEQ